MWVPWHIEEGHDTQEAPGIYQEQGPTSRGIHSYWVVITLIVIYDDLCQANVFLQFMVLDFWSKWWELVVLGNIGGEVRSFQNLCLLLDPVLQASSIYICIYVCMIQHVLHCLQPISVTAFWQLGRLMWMRPTEGLKRDWRSGVERTDIVKGCFCYSDQTLPWNTMSAKLKRVKFYEFIPFLCHLGDAGWWWGCLGLIFRLYII